ncbi:YidH family protein [Pseudalkalibacillus caeni]|uniref:DUF202 domain-containing protein n=1 Tax=Exobacillus caeni TaxID=2574798 RepID=A0A5R9EZ30_9BACL|nr:DUF202 domain-containing protein [Pseudalkalibacillus caeni]TLS35456.1 DUF202 domain-containing protein [Pseudalkalibacillus caeni]
MKRNIPEKENKNEMTYIQQHLANERTYLAWIRTAIAIMGVGFLVTNLHFTMREAISGIEDFIARMIGLFSVILGIVTIVFSTVNYYQKRDQINQAIFKSPKITVFILSALMTIVMIIFFAYFLSI